MWTPSGLGYPTTMVGIPRQWNPNSSGTTQGRAAGRAAGAKFRGAMSRRAPSRQGSRAAARSRYTLMGMDARSLTRRFLMTALAVAVLAAAGAVCLALPGPAGSAVSAGEHGATALLGRAPGSLAELQKEARRTRAQMERLNAEMEVVTQKWEAARRRLDEVNAKLVQARRQLTRSRNELDRQRALVAGRMRTMYKTGEFTWLDIVTSASSLTDAETVIDFLRKISLQDRHEESELQRLTGLARRDENAVEEDRQQAVQAQAELENQRFAVDQKIAERAALLKEVVAKIKKILSAPELLMKAGGKITQVTWAQAFLKSLGVPLTADNVAAIVAWEMAEGGHVVGRQRHAEALEKGLRPRDLRDLAAGFHEQLGSGEDLLDLRDNLLEQGGALGDLLVHREALVLELGLRLHGLLPILLDRVLVTSRKAREPLQLRLLVAVLQGDLAQEVDDGLSVGQAGRRGDDVEPRELAGLVHGAHAPGHERALPVELARGAGQLAPGLDEVGVDLVEPLTRGLPLLRDALHLRVQPLHLRPRAAGLLLQLGQRARRAAELQKEARRTRAQ